MFQSIAAFVGLSTPPEVQPEPASPPHGITQCPAFSASYSIRSSSDRIQSEFTVKKSEDYSTQIRTMLLWDLLDHIDLKQPESDPRYLEAIQLLQAGVNLHHCNHCGRTLLEELTAYQLNAYIPQPKSPSDTRHIYDTGTERPAQRAPCDSSSYR